MQGRNTCTDTVLFGWRYYYQKYPFVIVTIICFLPQHNHSDFNWCGIIIGHLSFGGCDFNYFVKSQPSPHNIFFYWSDIISHFLLCVVTLLILPQPNQQPIFSIGVYYLHYIFIWVWWLYIFATTQTTTQNIS